MKTWILLSLLLSAEVASADEECAPVATITESYGRIEIKNAGQWQRIFLLHPLCDGAIIRVGKKDRAVLTYLGFSTKVLLPSDSPYTVREPMLPQSISQKARVKLRDIFLRLMHRSRDQTASLMTRSNPADAEKKEIHSVGLHCRSMLLPMHEMVFRWEGGKPPYLVRISEKDPQPEGKMIYEAKVQKNSVAIPANMLREMTAYQWVVISGLTKGSGEFKVLGRDESRSIQLELAELLLTVSAESEATRILIEHGFLIERGCLCDAERVRAAGENKFPGNVVFKSLALSKAAE